MDSVVLPLSFCICKNMDKKCFERLNFLVIKHPCIIMSSLLCVYFGVWVVFIFSNKASCIVYCMHAEVGTLHVAMVF